MSARISPSRRTAFELLQAVLRRRRLLDEALAESRAFGALAGRDRAFVRHLVATTLRRLGQIDALVDHCLERPLPRKAAAVRDLLRLGVAQLLFLDVPAHAAVDTVVGLAQALGRGPHKGLINAVLRRLAREGRDLLAAQDAPRLNTPEWLWDSWRGAYGEETARAIAAAHLDEPPLDLTAKADPEAWAARLDAEVLPTGTLRRRGGGAVTELPGYAEGAWWVQDAAAALPVRLLGEVRNRTVIDLCAAPGGKTAQLAAAGARVVAVDSSEARLAVIARNLKRLGLTAGMVPADARQWRPPEPAELVLLDAPCTATGAIRRHPDVPHLKRPDDVAKQAALQAALLAAAVDMLAPGGRLVFCTCSLQPEEGPDRAAALLAAGAPVAREAVSPDEVAGLSELVTRAGDLRTLPCHLAPRGGLDGFYAVRLRRVG